MGTQKSNLPQSGANMELHTISNERGVFMDTGYQSNVKIDFISGDVKIDVSNGKETFSFVE